MRSFANKCKKVELKGLVKLTHNITISMNFKHGTFDALKRFESTEVYRSNWPHVPSATPWSTSSDTHQVVEIQTETSTKMYTPF